MLVTSGPEPPGIRLSAIVSAVDDIRIVLPDAVSWVLGSAWASRLLVEVELLEFLLRLTEVLFVSVDGPRALPLAPLLREESVQTVWRESFALRYLLSDVFVPVPSAVASAQWPRLPLALT